MSVSSCLVVTASSSSESMCQTCLASFRRLPETQSRSPTYWLAIRSFATLFGVRPWPSHLRDLNSFESLHVRFSAPIILHPMCGRKGHRFLDTFFPLAR